MSKSGLILPYEGVVPTIDSSVFIAPGATVVGDTTIGPESSIWHNTVVRGDVRGNSHWAGTNIQDGSVVHVTSGKFGAYIGDGITIGHMATIHACALRDGCFIGMSATVMDGAVVEERAMVAAGALVASGKIARRTLGRVRQVYVGELSDAGPARRTVEKRATRSALRKPIKSGVGRVSQRRAKRTTGGSPRSRRPSEVLRTSCRSPKARRRRKPRATGRRSSIDGQGPHRRHRSSGLRENRLWCARPRVIASRGARSRTFAIDPRCR